MEGRIMLCLKMEKQSPREVKYLIQAKAKCECESMTENVVCLPPLWYDMSAFILWLDIPDSQWDIGLRGQIKHDIKSQETYTLIDSNDKHRCCQVTETYERKMPAELSEVSQKGCVLS